MIEPHGTDEPTVVRGEAPEAAPPAATGRPFGPYRLISELGHGGMGVVWKAHDTRLDRIVAIKGILSTFREANVQQVERFLREARAAARLRHPNIVSVHEVGEIDGQHYLVCDYIEGEPLSERMTRAVPPREAASLVRAIALALQAAHDQGIVHRDVKPSNILLDRTGVPHVTDFGLAKDVRNTEGAKLTLSGDLLGTPAYMSPEQARGDTSAVGPASDQFSLGAVLYEMLTGRVPFDGLSLGDLLRAVVEREPARPTAFRANLHRDLETICMKALEKDPARRYPRIADLGEDLRRFLEGEPILARPIGRIARAWRRARRYPLATTLAAATLLAATTTAAVWWRSRVMEERAALAAREAEDRYLRQLARSGDALVQAALGWRAKGEVTRSRTFLEGVNTPVRELIALNPRLAEPYYHLGRMLRAVGREDEAERAQDEAVMRARATDATAGSRAVLHDALYERGVLRAGRYLRTLERKRTALLQSRAAGEDPSGPAPPMPAPEEVEEEFGELVELRRAALEDLRLALEGPRVGPVDEARLGVARGLVAVLDVESSGDAANHLRRAVELDPYVPEAYVALAGLAARRGAWEEAADWYEKGHHADLGYIPHLSGLADALARASLHAEMVGTDASELRERALVALESGVRMDPDQPELWRKVCLLRWYEGLARARRGDDPEETYRQALDAGDRALRLDPKDALTTNTRAAVCKSIGDWLRERGQDPREKYSEALAWYRASLSLDPEYAGAANNVAEVLLDLGRWLAARGRDPSKELEEALASAERALFIQPRLVEAADTQGRIHLERGNWLRSLGRDPSDAYASSEGSFRRALSIQGGYAAAANHLGIVHRQRGEWLEEQGNDPSAEFAKSLAALERALALHPAYAVAEANIAATYVSRGKRQAALGDDPTASFDKALAACGRALSNRPRWVEVLVIQGNARRGRGEWLASRGGDPSDAYEGACESYELALSVDPACLLAVRGEAAAHLSLALWLQARGKDPSQALAQALAGYERVLASNASDVEALNNLGNVRKALGDRLVTEGKDPTGEYAQAVQAYERALAIHPRLAAAANNLGFAHESIARWQREVGADPTAAYAEALRAYDAALAANPKFAEALNNRGNVHTARGALNAARRVDPSEEYTQALEDYDKALAVNPKYVSALHNRANACLNMGDASRAQGKDPKPRYEEALRGFDAVLALNGALWQAHSNRGVVLERLGRLDEAIAAHEQALRACPGQRLARARLVHAHIEVARAKAAPAGDAEAARLREEAFRHLRMAVDLGFTDSKQLDEDVRLAPLRDDPRWADIMKGLAPR